MNQLSLIGSVISKFMSFLMFIIRRGAIEEEKIKWRLRRLAENLIEDFKAPKVLYHAIYTDLYNLYKDIVETFKEGSKKNFRRARNLFLKLAFLFERRWSPPLSILLYSSAILEKVEIPSIRELFSEPFVAYYESKVYELTVKLEDIEIRFEDMLLASLIDAIGLSRSIEIDGRNINIVDPWIFVGTTFYLMLISIEKDKDVPHEEIRFWLKYSYDVLESLIETKFRFMLSTRLRYLEKSKEMFPELTSVLEYVKRDELLVIQKFVKEFVDKIEELAKKFRVEITMTEAIRNLLEVQIR